MDLKHKHLKVWENGMTLIRWVYKTTENFPSTEKFGLTAQMRRAAVSICSNLSEGSSRNTQKERCRYYEIARSSLVELDTQLDIAKELSFIEADTVENISELFNTVFAQLCRLIART